MSDPATPDPADDAPAHERFSPEGAERHGAPQNDPRAERLAAALRRNLHRRKAQRRARADTDPGADPVTEHD